jgi:Zn-dependent M28 family amino/carboxypeptidase
VVKTLASPEMEGRRGEGARKAAAFLIEEFQRLNLEPLFQGQFVQEIPSSQAGRLQGRNVGAILRGSDPAVRDQWVIVSAHYDHLGRKGDVLYPGADDNASGVAMMLEVARAMMGSARRPRRSVAFIGFDLEEAGLFGSRYLVAHPPFPIEQIALFITADMIGRALGGICETHVFVLGTEHVPGLRPWIDKAAKDKPLTIGLLGSDLLVLNRSDYGPFRNRQVPYLFFSTGENPRYHSPDDRPETLNYPKLTAISRVIHEVTVTASNAPEVPRWCQAPDHPLAEAVTIHDVIQKLLENRETLKLGAAQLFVMNSTLGTLKQIIARGAITPAERDNVIQAARLVLLMIH